MGSEVQTLIWQLPSYKTKHKANILPLSPYIHNSKQLGVGKNNQKPIRIG